MQIEQLKIGRRTTLTAPLLFAFSPSLRRIGKLFESEAVAAESEKPLELIVETQTEETFKLIFPFDKDYNPREVERLDDDGLITYMNELRIKTNVTWAKSLADLYLQPWNPIQWVSFLQQNKIIGDQTPYVPLKDIRKYQRSSSGSQETCNVDSRGNCIIPKPLLFQETPTGMLIPVEISELGLHRMRVEAVQQTEGRYANGLIAFDSSKVRRRRGRIIRTLYWEVYTIDPNNPEEPKNLTKKRSNDWAPIWSPDGKYIGFESDRYSEDSDLLYMNEDGSDVRRLKFDVSFFGVPINYFPDRGYIVSLSQKTLSKINFSGSDKQGTQILSEDDCRVRYHDISLDGNTLAFFCVGDETNELVTIDLETTKVLSKLKLEKIDGIKVSPDGNEVLFKDRSELYKYTRAADTPTKLDIKGLPQDYKIGDYVWSPDGRKIAFFASPNAHTGFRLYQMGNDGNNLEIISKVRGYNLSWQPIPKSPLAAK